MHHAPIDRPHRSGRKWAAVAAIVVVVVAGIAFAVFSGHGSGNKPVAEPNSPAPDQSVPADALTVGKGGKYSTIQDAVNAAQPGQTVAIYAGTYHEAVTFPRSGKSGAPITVEAATGAKVTIDGEGTLPASSSDPRGLLTLDHRQYIRIIGLTITKSKQHGIYAGHTSDITIEKNEVEYSQDGGILVGNGSNVTIQNNDVHHNNYAAHGGDTSLAANEAITLFDVQKFEIKNNKVYENDEEGIDVKNGTSDGTVHSNDTYRNNGPNIYVDGASDVQVYNNRIYSARGPSKAGIGLAVESGGSAENVQIYNNVIYSNPGGGIDFWVGHYSNVQVYNNTIYSNGKDAIRADNGTVSDSTAINNIVYKNPLNNVDGFTLTNNLTSNPDFVDLAKGDVQLKAGSPAIDAASKSKTPAFDFDDTARPVGNGPDIGAFEYDPSKN